MTFPWEQCDFRPELVKDPRTGLWPGQRDEYDLPDFLRRLSLEDSPPAKAPS